MENQEEQKTIMKAAFKEAAREWMDEAMLTFGRWSLMTLAAAFTAALCLFILTINGWHK